MLNNLSFPSLLIGAKIQKKFKTDWFLCINSRKAPVPPDARSCLHISAVQVFLSWIISIFKHIVMHLWPRGAESYCLWIHFKLFLSLSPKIYAAIDPVRKIWNELGLLFDDPQVKEVLTLVLLSVASVSGYIFIHLFFPLPLGHCHLPWLLPPQQQPQQQQQQQQ